MSSEELIERAKYEPLRSSPPDPVAEALESMPYGLYIIGSRSDAGDRNGMMADWVMQVSFKPRLVCCSMERDATTLRFVRETGVFTVNVLPVEAKELAQHFAQPRDASKIRGRAEESVPAVFDKLAGIDYALGEETQCPVLNGGLAYIECAARDFVDQGDHTLVIGEVLSGDVLRDGEPLTQRHLGWSYGG